MTDSVPESISVALEAHEMTVVDRCCSKCSAEAVAESRASLKDAIASELERKDAEIASLSAQLNAYVVVVREGALKQAIEERDAAKAELEAARKMFQLPGKIVPKTD